jgi:hypothetical protein
VADSHAQLLAAIRRYGPSVEAIAGQYTNPVTGQHLSGAALLAKTLQGESGALTDPVAARNADSGKAHGWAQFTPGSRQVAISKFGVDPNHSIDEAVHAMALHLRGKINGATGLKGYNPGDPTYTNYILGQKVGSLGGSGGSSAPSAGSGSATPIEATAAQAAPWDTASAGPGLADLLGQLQSSRKPQAVQSMGLQAPSFSAGPTLPAGYQAPVSGGGGAVGAKGSDLAGMLQAVSATPSPGLAPVSSGTPTAPDVASNPSPAASGGSSSSPGAITDVKRLLSRAAAIDSQHLPYVYGGGHTAKTSKPGTPLDCSAAVSKVLGIDPRVSGDFEQWGKAGTAPAKKGGVTVYANKGHVLMEIDGHFWGTSATNPNGGAGWIPKSAISQDYLKNFTARHL